MTADNSSPQQQQQPPQVGADLKVEFLTPKPQSTQQQQQQKSSSTTSALKRAFFSIYSYSVLYALFGVLSLTYHSCFNSSLSTLEKRYHFSSQTGSFVMITDNIATVLTNLFIGYYGKNAHKPRWMSVGCFISGLSVMLTALPYFIYGSSDADVEFNSALSSSLFADSQLNSTAFTTTTTQISTFNSISIFNKQKLHYDSLCQSTKAVENCSQQSATKMMTLVAVTCFAISNFFRGFGTSIYFTYGTPYLDDNVSKRSMPTYFALVFSARIFGAPLGYLMSSIALKHYENPYNPNNIKETDANWVGAWWIGFLVSGALMVLVSIPLSFFPREFKNRRNELRRQREQADAELALTTTSTSTSSVNKNNNQQNIDNNLKQLATTTNNDHDDDINNSIDDNNKKTPTNQIININNKKEIKNDSSNTWSLSELPREIFEIVTNPIVACQMLGNLFRGIGIIGFFVFQAKYIEAQFKQSASRASLISGTTGVLAKVVGVMFGGVFISLMKPKATKLTIFIFLVELTTVFTLLYGANVVGPEYKYPGMSLNEATGTMIMTSKCAEQCNCQFKKFQPICDSESHDVFLSPCHAGCKNTFEESSDKSIRYTECDCVSNTFKIANSCTHSEDKMRYYATVIALGAMISGSSRSGNMVTFFRSIRPDQKSLAVAVQSFWHSLFVSIPYPLLYGYIFDSTCQFWSVECGKRGNCWSYDSTKLRQIYHGVSIALVALGSVFDLLMVFLSPRLGDLYDDGDDKDSPTSRVLSIVEKAKFWKKKKQNNNENTNDATTTTTTTSKNEKHADNFTEIELKNVVENNN